MNKLSILDPNSLEETNYAIGRHSAQPAGRVVYPESDEVMNLHYKFIDRDYVKSRAALLLRGLGKLDMAAGLGRQYTRSPDQLEDEWLSLASGAMDYRDPRVGFATHLDRWWRGARRRS